MASTVDWAGSPLMMESWRYAFRVAKFPSPSITRLVMTCRGARHRSGEGAGVVSQRGTPFGDLPRGIEHASLYEGRREGVTVSGVDGEVVAGRQRLNRQLVFDCEAHGSFPRHSFWSGPGNRCFPAGSF